MRDGGDAGGRWRVVWWVWGEVSDEVGKMLSGENGVSWRDEASERRGGD